MPPIAPLPPVDPDDPPLPTTTKPAPSLLDPSRLPFVSYRHQHDNRTHLLLCATGSVATIKIPLILQSLSAHPRLSVRLLLSPSASKFLSGVSAEQPTPSTLLDTIPNLEAIYTDEDEWAVPWKRGEGILHIELRRWADLMVIAPLSANSMAKIVNGIADGLITSVFRAWDTTGTIDGVRDVVRQVGTSDRGAETAANGAPSAISKNKDRAKRRRVGKVILVAPAMNTAMWNHPVTKKHLKVLEEEWGVDAEGEDGGWIEVLRPIEKELACGDTGAGAMRDWTEVVRFIRDRLGLQDEGKKTMK